MTALVIGGNDVGSPDVLAVYLVFLSPPYVFDVSASTSLVSGLNLVFLSPPSVLDASASTALASGIKTISPSCSFISPGTSTPSIFAS